MRRLAGVLSEEKQLRAAAAGGPAAQGGLAGAPPRARPVVLRHSGAVLAVTGFDPAATGFDPATPNAARVYSRLLGGKDHFPSDRGEADALLEIYPPLADMARENRAFIAEAVTWAAGEGIVQFIDLGAGLPVAPAVHQSAQAVRPGARVAYVDLDPVVLSHARALLAGPRVAVAEADLRDPAAVLADPELRAVIDPAEPVCVILAAVLHFLDADTARQVTAGYARLAAPGSCLAISVAAFDDEDLAGKLAWEYTAGEFVNHGREDIASFFAGLPMAGPGVSEAQTWRPWQPEPVFRRREGHVLAGVGRVPAAEDLRTARHPACPPGVPRARRPCQAGRRWPAGIPPHGTLSPRDPPAGRHDRTAYGDERGATEEADPL
jgi:hypothetical protein